MMKTYHILNGDALADRFPTSIQGERIVLRECWVDYREPLLDEAFFFEERAKYLTRRYPSVPLDMYHQKVLPEIQKMDAITDGDQVYFWFEEDLFCQVNWWFAAGYIFRQGKTHTSYLICPEGELRYGFAAFDTRALETLINQKIEIGNLGTIAALWTAYRQKDQEQLLYLAKAISSKYPFILRAAEAQAARFPKDGDLGLPHQVLQALIKSEGTKDLKKIFPLFANRLPNYGFGDAQVAAMIEELNPA